MKLSNNAKLGETQAAATSAADCQAGVRVVAGTTCCCGAVTDLTRQYEVRRMQMLARAI
jgi:hypothetical protein